VVAAAAAVGLKKAPGFEVESTSIHPSSSTWKKKMMEEEE
jgi:hypothetical protein